MARAARGNDDVMVRGTFANIRIKNLFFGGEEGGNTLYFGSNPPEKMSIYDAAMKYKADGTPLVVIAGHEYGTGSSRDWAAKGTNLLGVKAVIAASFERIHRSNLVGMGVLPLQFHDGENAQTLAWTARCTRSPAWRTATRARPRWSRARSTAARCASEVRAAAHPEGGGVLPARRAAALRAAAAGRRLAARLHGPPVMAGGLVDPASSGRSPAATALLRRQPVSTWYTRAASETAHRIRRGGA